MELKLLKIVIPNVMNVCFKYLIQEIISFSLFLLLVHSLLDFSVLLFRLASILSYGCQNALWC